MSRGDVFEPLAINSISEFCRLMELPAPGHPLVCVIRFDARKRPPVEMPPRVVLNLFSIWLKKGVEMGAMRLLLPGQVICREGAEDPNEGGMSLLIHPELLWNYSVEKNLEQYGLFASAVADSLPLGGKEERLITGILQNIEQEYLPPVNVCCQEAILSHVEALFVFAERFYRRRCKQDGADEQSMRHATIPRKA